MLARIRFSPAAVALLLVCAGSCACHSQQVRPVVWPSSEWPRAAPDEVGMVGGLLEQARDYALTGGGSGYIIRAGKLVMSWGDPAKRYDVKSTTKSFGATALALAIQERKVRLHDKARQCHPSFGEAPEGNVRTGWLDEITLFHLATHTAGFAKRGGYTELLFAPGTRWHYSDGGPNWLAECLTLAYGRDLQEVMFERVFTPIGITRGDLVWRENIYRPHEINGIKRREFGAGIHANVDAMARIGYLYLRGGRWGNRQIIPRAFVELAGRSQPQLIDLPVTEEYATYGRAPDHYGLLWWNNADETLEGVPLDAFWAWGLHESLIVVIPSLDIVIARAGDSWKRTEGMGHYDPLKPFLLPIVASVWSRQKAAKDGGKAGAPYRESRVIRSIEWAPREEIIRLAAGSDNWPMTWADDGDLYTAYGDGWGFEPRVPEKLSLGLARVVGIPPDIRGINLRSATAEQKGGGKAGQKASGLLMVGGVLYMWVRNAENSQLAWSRDRGQTWTRADWRFTTSFGAPTFLNFGKNYAGARDEYVYVYSHDSDSAYESADRMVLARVPKDRIAERKSYEFFVRLDERGNPVWTTEIGQRGAVFSNPGKVYRSGISYTAGLKRYLWYQLIPGGDTRFEGGLGIYDAPEPWGPWTTVYFTEQWDVGPGESGSFPPKWMSMDGRTMYLVFSGDDFFSVRKATVLSRDER